MRLPGKPVSTAKGSGSALPAVPIFGAGATAGRWVGSGDGPRVTREPVPPQPELLVSPYRWEYVEGGHWLVVWGQIQCYDQHFVPGDWQTCGSGYGCISNWTWWLKYPESKLGVPSTWRSIWPGAQALYNYIATYYFN